MHKLLEDLREKFVFWFNFEKPMVKSMQVVCGLGPKRGRDPES